MIVSPILAFLGYRTLFAADKETGLAQSAADFEFSRLNSCLFVTIFQINE